MDVAIVGATGYSGVELIRLLQDHPYASIKTIVSTSQSGEAISSIYPHLQSIVEDDLQGFDGDALAANHDLIFLATPAGVSSQLYPQFAEKPVKWIDLSGDFRLTSGQQYRQWYGRSPAPEDLLRRAVYGLSEINQEAIAGASYVANPGCYSTAALLALIPALKSELIDPGSIIIDAKSGVSGAGRSATDAVHFVEVNDNLRAYKVGVHQHVPEIEQTLATVCGCQAKVLFSPHLLPITRGLMCTIYGNLSKDSTSSQEVQGVYADFYQTQPFVRISPAGHWPTIKEVVASNFCNIGIGVDERTGRLVLVSVIDNLVKGAAGQAVQNMNILFGWDVTCGLNAVPVCP